MAISGVNLLNRTCFSTGFYRVRDLAVAANQGNIKVLGIADDFFVTPLSKECRSRKDFERLFVKDIYHQRQIIQTLRPEFTNLEIYFGAVIDLSFNMEILPYIAQFSSQFNYLLFKNVHQENIEYFFEQRKRFQCPVGLCQNNLKGNFPKFNIDRLIQVLNQHKIFIELDTKLPYFLENNKFFARVRGTPIRVTIGTDTHQDLSEVCEIQVASEYIERFGLENNLLTLNLGNLGTRPAYQKNPDYRKNNRPRFYSPKRPNKENYMTSSEKTEVALNPAENTFSPEKEILTASTPPSDPIEITTTPHSVFQENLPEVIEPHTSEPLTKSPVYSARPPSINRDYRSHRDRNV